MLNESDGVDLIMNSREIIVKNCPWCPEYDEASFAAILHEQGVWQRDQYWILEWALYDILSSGENLEKLYGPIFRIFSYTMSVIISNFDQNDLFEIKNLGRDEIYEFRERIQMIFEGFFAGRMPEHAIFNEVNPFLENGGSGFGK